MRSQAMRMKELLHERPYLSAIAAGALWNAVGASEEIKALMTSALVVGLCVGLLGKAGWRSLLTKVPASLGCFVLVALCVDIGGRVLGRREANMYSVMNMVMTVYSSPLVIVGVLVGSAARAVASGRAAAAR